MAIVYWNDSAVIGPVIAAFKPAVLEMQQVAKGLAPVGKTGSISSSVVVGFQGETMATMRDTSPHAGPVIKGAAPHQITPSAARALSTPYGPKASVQHPGNRPNPFLREAQATFRTIYTNTCRGMFALGGILRRL